MSIGLVTKSKAPRFMAVRMLAMSPYADTMIARTGDLTLAQPRQQGQPVHHRHVDVEQHQLDPGSSASTASASSPWRAKRKAYSPRADLAAEALADQRLEVRLVVDGEDLDLAGHRRPR